jgi:chemotaxis-related protein WspB
MLLLLFYLGEDCYALESRQLIEVVPLVPLKPLCQTEAAIAGGFQYREQLVPVLDLKRLLLNQGSRSQLSTRIMLINPMPDRGFHHPFGLIAERVTEMIQASSKELETSGIAVLERPYLGKLMAGDQGTIQQINLEGLLPVFQGIPTVRTANTHDDRPNGN